MTEQEYKGRNTVLGHFHLELLFLKFESKTSVPAGMMRMVFCFLKGQFALLLLYPASAWFRLAPLPSLPDITGL